MLAAMERGRDPAVDYLNGEIVDRGERLGVPTPVNRAACQVVWEISAGKRKAGSDALRSLVHLAQLDRPLAASAPAS